MTLQAKVLSSVKKLLKAARLTYESWISCVCYNIILYNLFKVVN